MSLFVQSQLIELNQTGIFTFPDVVLPGNYVVGSSMFSLYYPNLNAYNVTKLNMSLSHGQQDSKTIYVTVNGSMNDDHNHVADTTSRCIVVVIAWVGSSGTPTLMMGNLTGVSTSNSPTITMPTGAVQVNTFLSGFSIELSSEQGITSWSATSAANVDSLNNTASITGGSLLNGTAGTVDVGVLISTDANAPYQMMTQSVVDYAAATFNFNPAIASAVTALASFGAEFNGSSVVLMNADADIYTLPPGFPTTTINIMADIWGVQILNHSANATGSNVNVFALGVNNNSLSGAFERINRRLWHK